MTLPAARLKAADIYRFIDRAEDAFRAGDDLVEVVRDGRLRLVSTVDVRLKHLVGVVVHMRDPHYSEAMTLIAEAKRARIARGVDVADVFSRLRTTVAAWDARHESVETVGPDHPAAPAAI